MTKYLTLLLLLITSLFSRGQIIHNAVKTSYSPHSCDSTHRKQVFIIGIIHSGNKVLNADSLMKILSLIKPDLVLKEEVSAKIPFHYRIGKIFGFVHQSVEEKAANRYKKKHGTKIASYDIEFDRRKYAKENPIIEKNLWTSVNCLYHENKLSPQQKKFIDDYNTSSDYFWKYVKDSNLVKMNQKNVIDSSKKFMELYALNMYSLVNQHDTTRQYSSFVQEDLSFWERRNTKMAENILHYIKSSNSGRIVVLTGLLHKYYLLDLLSPKQQQCCFEINENWWINL